MPVHVPDHLAHVVRVVVGQVALVGADVDRVLPVVPDVGDLLAGHFFFNASGLWTASPPLLSLLTRYCGSSLDALTSRLAACVSLVIFFSTVPSAVLP